MQNSSKVDLTKPDLFTYDNYLFFLNDTLEYLKKLNKNFTFRYFAKKASFKSHSHLHKILSGQTVLSLEFAIKLGKALGFTKKNQDYFNTLVLYNQSQESNEKSDYFFQLKKYRNKILPVLNSDQHGYFDEWYLQVLRELVVFAPWKGNYKRLGQFLEPPLSETQVKEGLEKLINLNLLKKMAGNLYKHTDEIVSAKDFPSHVLKRARTEMIIRAIQAGDSLPISQRHLSYCTFTLSKTKYLEMCQQIDEIRQRFLLDANENKEGDGVYSFCVQLYPLSKHWT